MKRIVIAVSIAVIGLLGLSQVAFAAEWNPNDETPGGSVAAKENARSECLFNGLDEPDETSQGALDGEPLHENPPASGNYVGDDGDWGSTPAGANSNGPFNVQSGGQITAASVQATGDPGTFTGGTGVQGVACNGHLNPINTD